MMSSHPRPVKLIQNYIKINSGICFGPINYNFHFKDCFLAIFEIFEQFNEVFSVPSEKIGISYVVWDSRSVKNKQTILLFASCKAFADLIIISLKINLFSPWYSLNKLLNWRKTTWTTLIILLFVLTGCVKMKRKPRWV